jgi:C-terminal processing protease CtpA/Prc
MINNKQYSYGSKYQLKKIEKLTVLFDNTTASSAEQLMIALLSLRDKIEIVFKGTRTAGFTSSNMYFELPNGGGIEIPYGYMADFDKKVYKKGLNKTLLKTNS